MQKKRLWGWVAGVLLATGMIVGNVPAVFAVTSSSANYQVTELEFGSSTNQESCSNEYCARASIGDVAAGRSAGTTTAATFGSVTPDEPVLEVIVDPGASHLGMLSTTETATKESTIRVRNYMSGGYMLQIIGDAPKYGNHKLATSASPVASTPGKEQFGINLVANTTPGLGKNPEQVPSNETSFGEVEAAYRTPDRFKFNSGDVVARSDSESGRTDYTISMVINISNSTPAGHYTGDFSAVVIPVY